jgi:glycosyltransferase involved in cell wall biosynthesis
MKEAKISVIVCIHNIEPYLPKCIESLLVQSFTNFELILVDNGSPDNCPDICDRYASTDNRIKVIHKINEGLLSARKAGLEKAKGKYVAYVDGDDWVDIFYLETLYKIAKANDADMTVTGHFKEFDGKIETIKPILSGIFDESQIRSEILPKVMYNGRFCQHGISTYVWNKLFKKELLNEILFKVPNEIVMGEDAAITYAYLSISKKIVVSRIPLYYYRQRNDSIVKSIENPKMEYFRLGLLANFLKTELANVLDEENLNRQITFYLYAQILVRSGGMIYNSSENSYFNPFNVSQNSRVVVYSSGSFGQHLLSVNSKTRFFKIVKWMDIDFHEISIDGNYVEPLGPINDEEFDHLIIASVNPLLYEPIRTELKLMGIDERKIAEINTNESDIAELLDKLGYDENFRYHLNEESKL